MLSTREPFKDDSNSPDTAIDVDDVDDLGSEDENGPADAADDSGTGDGTATLDALEAEEIESVETNESATMLVDEAGEIVAIRREEMTLDVESEERRGDEFVCRSCFLLLKNVQLADPREMLCADCA